MATTRVELTREGFEEFKGWVTKLGFREVDPSEAKLNSRHYRLVSPRKGEGGAVSFTLTVNELEVVIWTTFRKDLGRGTSTGYGWVVITVPGRRIRLHVRRPTRRTKNFWKNLYMRARASRWVAMRVPMCPKCQTRMAIVRGRSLGSRYFRCPNGENHIGEKRPTVDFDAVSHHPRVLSFIQKERMAKKRARHDRRLRGRGPVRVTRKPWRRTEPAPTYPV